MSLTSVPRGLIRQPVETGGTQGGFGTSDEAAVQVSHGKCGVVHADALTRYCMD
jgi:hypothetical protein